MNKPEIKTVVEDLRNHKTYPGVDTEPLHGLALSDFPSGKYVRQEVISNFLNWQCAYMDGTFDEPELDNCLYLLKKKRVIMV